MGNALMLTQLLIQLMTQAKEIGGILTAAQREGRDVTKEELDKLFQSDDAARSRLQAAIDAS